MCVVYGLVATMHVHMQNKYTLLMATLMFVLGLLCVLVSSVFAVRTFSLLAFA